MTVAEQLRELAAAEETLTQPDPRTCPEMVDRAYHAGRQSGLQAAASLLEHDRAAHAAESTQASQAALSRLDHPSTKGGCE